MRARLRQITRYPYPLLSENNIVTLAYTCFADSSTARELDIQTHAFRFIRNDLNEELMLLVIRDEEIHESQVGPVLHVPFNILRQFNDAHPEVPIFRRTLEMESCLLPKLKVATEVNFYFNESFTPDKELLSMLTQSSFCFKNGEAYLDFSWLKKHIGKIKNVKSKLQMRERLSQHESGRCNIYLRCFVEAVDELQSSQYLLFKNGATKANIKSNPLHPYNIYRMIRLDHLQRKIFELSPYQQLSKLMSQDNVWNSIVLLEADSNVGVAEFLHFFSQTRLGVNFWSIDCQSAFSTQEFFRRLSWVSNLQDSVVLIYNLQWLLQLYQAEQILTMQMKQIISKIQKEFTTLTKQTLRKYSIVLMYQGKTLSSDMLQEAHSATLSLQKPLRAYIFKTIFQHSQHSDKQAQSHFRYEQLSDSFRDSIVQHCHDKFGWQIFKQFMDHQWKSVRQKSPTEILKELSKLVKQEEVQNLIEVSWDDVGGLQTAKDEIIQTILLPIKHPEIFDEWIKPRTGLLFYGPPGTGKTLLGKCIAKECKMSFISVKGPQLLNMYVGESEKNVRQIFQRAIACKPCIVFMDELDALVPKRGNNSDSHQVMDRIVAQLLMQMDRASANQVFVIGATNRPDLLDPSILRPGRFDKQIYLGITTDLADRIKILKAQTRHLTLQENMDWELLLSHLPENLTGADFYGLTSKAVMAAAQRVIEQYERGITHDKIVVGQRDFIEASEKVKPSVTEADLRRYDQLKQIYS